MSPARSLMMWAAVVTGSRAQWIHHDTIAHSRREARRKYEAFWDEEFRPRAVKEHGIKFVRVIVQLAGAPK